MYGVYIYICNISASKYTIGVHKQSSPAPEGKYKIGANERNVFENKHRLCEVVCQ